MTLQLAEEDRQVIVLALAHLAVDRPGWDDLLQRIASELGGLEMYKEFERMYEDFKRLKLECLDLRRL